jgi:adenine-specific DNA-methyltransferase
MSEIHLLQGDCAEVMTTIAPNSVDLILTDPPYYKVKGDYWDRQWDTAQGFLDWLDGIMELWYSILKPNGSVYVFASPQMSARVETLTGKRFNVLNNIRWVKEAGWHNKTEKEALRSFLSPYESVVFAEHYGADGYAKGEAGYSAKVDELRGFVFKPLLDYIEGERLRAGVSKEDINEALGCRRMGGMAGRHYFSMSQWCLPTAEHYQKMRECLSQLNHGGEYLKRDYEYLKRDYEDLKRDYEYLKRDYEDLKRDYEDLRRPFSVSADVPYTDVWTFKTVSHYAGKHPCEKPLEMLEHIIRTSSKEGATVLDCFMGTGNTGRAAVKLGRDFIGIDKDAKYFSRAEERISQAQMAMPL